LVLPRGEVIVPPFVALHEPIEPIEACAHDPPFLGPSSPRAPPA
jgi:hypothetical protein